MEIWRAVWRSVDDPEWRSVNHKIYLERRYATLAMRNEAGREAFWDDQEQMWVSKNGKKVFRVQKAEVEEWENVSGKQSKENSSRNQARKNAGCY